MKYLRLLLSNLGRKKIRTLFTVLSIAVAFLLFGLLAAIRIAFTAGVELAGEDRLLIQHKTSLIRLLPESYQSRIAQVDGVTNVAHATWLGGYFQDPRKVITAFPIDSENYIAAVPEFLMPEEQKQNFLDNRTGAVAGKGLAAKYGWQVGDRIPMRSSIWRNKDGTDTWELTLEAIYTAKDEKGDLAQFWFHYEYFDESRSGGDGLVGWYLVNIDDPQRAPQIAEEIDALFANSSAETKTASEKSFAQAWANQIGNIGKITIAVMTAVFFTMLLVTANTMAQSFRERISEIGVLKTLGFTNMGVTLLVLAESMLITIVGGGVGLFFAWLLINGMGDLIRQFLPVFYFPIDDLIIGTTWLIALGLFAGALPAAQAMRLKIVDALRSS